MWLLKLILILGLLYAAVVALSYVFQTRMLFPTHFAMSSGARLPATATRLVVETPTGERLAGVHIPPVRDQAAKQLTLLGFGGNAWNADTVASYLHELFPDVEVFAYHYRG